MVPYEWRTYKHSFGSVCAAGQNVRSLLRCVEDFQLTVEFGRLADFASLVRLVLAPEGRVERPQRQWSYCHAHPRARGRLSTGGTLQGGEL